MARITLSGIRTIYFDFDGTIHESNRVYAPAFRKAYRYLVDEGKAEERTFTDKEISTWLGYSRTEMWKNFMGHLEEGYRKTAGEMIGRTMREGIEEGTARLYEGAGQVLSELKKRGYVLVFLSNCGRKYMETSSMAFGLEKYFDSMICSEDHGYIPKDEILKDVMGSFPMGQVIVGDRFHDVESGVRNGIPSIFCEYGYGSLDEGKDATYRIKDIRELLDILP